MSGGGGGCNRFKQNAWKKEMCSNCYKTKDEHQDRPRPALPHLPLIPASQGILKGWDRDRKKKRKNVTFPKEECEVIGYGGEELSSEDEMDFEEIPSSREESSEEHEGEDDKVLKKLTKTNTDFNSVLCNLSGAKPAQTVLLGSQKRETIQVTVQPFNNNLANSRKLHLNKLLQDNTPSLTIIPCEKKEEPPPKEVETRKVNITRGSIITKNHESVKNKLYIQNMLNSKNEKRNSYNLMQEKVYITTNTSSKVSDEEKDENVDYMNGKNKNCVVLNCNGVSLLGVESEKDKVLESRELAGEPDGKADSDEAELPVTPPPRISFLHRESPEVKRVTETFENKRITTIETMHEIKRTIEPIDRSMTPSPETRLNELVEIRRLSIGENESRINEIKLTNSPDHFEFRKKDVSERLIEVNERRINDNSDILRRIEPASRRLSDSSENRRNVEIIDERRFSDIPDSWKTDNERRNSVSPDEVVRCKRQAPKPPQHESESEIESDVKAESDTSSECCERTTLRIDTVETTPVPMRPVRPETLKISVSSEESTTPSSSPEPDKPEGLYETRRNSPKREPPPLPPTTPEPRKSPPEPLPRHNKTSFMDVEKKKTKMKETIKKLLRFGTKEEMEVEVQSPRIRPQIIHPLDLNKSAVQVLPSSNMLKADTPTTPTPPALPIGRPNKPPPPPRSESLNLMERLKTKPGTENNIYANLGEARSGITPVKPVRTGSMREASGKLTAVIVKEPAAPPPQSKDIVQELTVVTSMDQRVTTAAVSCLDQDNLYEAIGSANSAPECDMAHQTYYGSETESDTYSAMNRQEVVGGEGRRGSTVVPYLSIEENLAALSQLNLQSINHLLTKILERDKNGASLGMYNLDVSSRKEICRAAFIQAERKREIAMENGSSKKVTLAITQSESSLILPHSVPVVARFTDTLPDDILPSHFNSTINEVTVIACSEASRLADGQCDEVDADESTEQKLLVLLQVLQIIGQISSRTCNLDNFILLKDSTKHYSVSYIHQQGTNDSDEHWKSSVNRLCDSYCIAEPLRQRLSSCQSDSEATLAVTCWLYGPPPSLGREALPSWLALQRAYALRTFLAKSDLAATQHLMFLASNFDLNKIFEESRKLQQPTEL